MDIQQIWTSPTLSALSRRTFSRSLRFSPRRREGAADTRARLIASNREEESDRVVSEGDNERGRERRGEEKRREAEMEDRDGGQRDIDPIFRRMPARCRSYRLTGASLDYDLS